MKPILIILSVIAFGAPVFSQGYMDSIVERSCECLNNISDTLDAQQKNLELGLCMIEASGPYKEQLKEDFDIDVENIDVEGEKLGRLIGMKMTTKCPGALMRLVQNRTDDANGEKEASSVHGVVTKIDKDFFVVFSIKDDSGKTAKYYWLTPVETDFDLTNEYNKLVDKTVDLLYQTENLFDPKIDEYRQFFVIKKINKAD